MDTNNRERFIVPKEVYNDLIENGSKRFKLLFEPEKYIMSAIIVLENQLANAKTHSKRQKIQSRINTWKQELEIIQSLPESNKEDNNETKETSKIAQD